MADSKPWLEKGRWHAAPAYWDDEALVATHRTPAWRVAVQTIARPSREGA